MDEKRQEDYVSPVIKREWKLLKPCPLESKENWAIEFKFQIASIIFTASEKSAQLFFCQENKTPVKAVKTTFQTFATLPQKMW